MDERLRERLGRDLDSAVRGEVRFDEGTRALYAADASKHRQVPWGVVLPADAEDAARAVELCRRHGAPVLTRGGGTSLAGQCCNEAVVLDCSRHLDRVLEIDPARRLARVQPGVVLDRLRESARRWGLTFAPDPASHAQCTIGGMIGNNAAGPRSLSVGRTIDHVEELDVLSYDGTRLRVGRTSEEEADRRLREGGAAARVVAGLRALRERDGDLWRRRLSGHAGGYQLARLLPEHGFDLARSLVGSEGTCVLVLEAVLRLVPEPAARAVLIAGFPELEEAAEAVPALRALGAAAIEGVDEAAVAALSRVPAAAGARVLLPSGRAWLVVELDGADRAEAREKARRVEKALAGTRALCRVVEDAEARRRLRDALDSLLAATARTPDGRPSWEGCEDSRVPPETLARYLRELRALLARFGYQAAIFGRFGEGAVQARVDFELATRDGLRRFRSFLDQAAELALGLGGAIVDVHGTGQARGALLRKALGPDVIESFLAFKRVWDPEGRMNPGKLADARPPDDDLRLGIEYAPPDEAPALAYPEDGDSLARASLRCVGAGRCRSEAGGVMCPSYRATREEKHSARGRARLLFEMLQGAPLRGGWRDPAVKEALDLCLSCKACKSECPASVDIGAYKAEFLARYYRGRLRPRAEYALGHLGRWVRAGARAPLVANVLTHGPIGALFKRALGLAPQRRLPRWASSTFRESFSPSQAGAQRPAAILWPDTYMDHFQPSVGRAAAAVIEAAGWSVRLPERPSCCGRPLYDAGMLEEARVLLRGTLAALRPELRAGVPIVVLEPSCASVFRDEALRLLPRDEDARRLASQTVLLEEFLERHAPGFPLPALEGRALVQGHCHQQALFDAEAGPRVLERAGLEVERLDAGCCGMSGGLGWQAGERYSVAQACADRALLPAVRAAPPETWLIADGFACRHQIEESSGRRALHLAEVLALGLGKR